ncbi:MAG: hypothetical protein WAQ28_14765, partial [Bacteroidia bacterium]
MKRISKAALLLFILMANMAISQNWSLNGNGNANALSILGPTNANSLKFVAGNTAPKMILLNTNGFLGLGTTSPVSLFHIDGSSNTGEVFRTTSSTNVVSAWRMLKGTGGTAEKFAIYVPSGSNNAILQVTQDGGHILFNTGGPGASPITRMIITDGNLGYVGVGTNFTTPQSLLHINDGTGAYVQLTGSATGSTAGDGFKVGINNSAAELRQQENAPINFLTFNVPRMTILGGPTNGATTGFVGIGTAAPSSLLHVNDGANATYTQITNNSTGTTATDGFKVGIDNVGKAQLINYESRPMTISTVSSGTNVVERMTIVPVTGNVGIGNFTNDPLYPFPNPAARLEILSNKTVATSNGAPQLRLTNYQQDPANSATTGKYAELHDGVNGDLNISARDNTQTDIVGQNLKERFVGINTLIPHNTVEINSQYKLESTLNGQPQAPGFGLPTGWAGLTFTDLKSTSVVQANPGVGVLSIDANGNVIYVPDGASA